VPRADSTPPDERPGRDQYAAGRVADDREHLGREGASETETGLDGGADDDQLGAVLVDDLG
jgi:hypothetical protein